MELNLKDYQVKQGVLQTKEIQAVLDEATEKGGLTVVIPSGEYITGTLNLGGASLYLEKGAVLKGSEALEDYYDNGFRHDELHETICLLYSMDHNDITISGEGVIDMNGTAFYDMNSIDVPEDGHVYSEEQKSECTRTIMQRPTQPVFFYNCHRVTMEKIKLVNAPCWTVSFHRCSDIRFTDITIDNHLQLPNNDGVHFCGCKNVFVRGCNIKAGDDCIAISGITDWDEPCDNIVISDCVMMSCSKALSIGYMHSIVRNVTITNCVIYDSQRGISFMSSKGTGLVEHVLIENVRVHTKVHAGNWWGNGEPICLMATFHHNSHCLKPMPVRNRKINIRDIRFKNISCSGENIIGVIGSDENIQDVFFEGISFERLPSKNRYLKGERCIDISPSQERADVPEDVSDFIYVRDCKSVSIRDCVELNAK